MRLLQSGYVDGRRGIAERQTEADGRRHRRVGHEYLPLWYVPSGRSAIHKAAELMSAAGRTNNDDRASKNQPPRVRNRHLDVGVE